MLATATTEFSASKKISWENFQKKYLTREDRFKYEWVNGMVHVYHGKNMAVCVGDDLCSAEPVVKGFIVPTKDIFK
jgi:hypothetical protein